MPQPLQPAGLRERHERVMLRRALLFGVSVFILAAGFMLPKIADRLGKISFQQEGRQEAWERRVRQENNSSQGEVKTKTADTESQAAQGGTRGDYLLLAGAGIASALLLAGLAYFALR